MNQPYVVEVHLAVTWFLKAVDTAYQRAFSRTRRPDNDHLFPFFDGKVDVLQNLEVSKAFTDVIQPDHDPSFLGNRESINIQKNVNLYK
jgi:hypothetical protein